MQSLKKIAPMAFAGARNASTLRKVCVIGAAGGIGQPLGLLMKMVRSFVPLWRGAARGALSERTRAAQNPAVGALSLYDMVGTPGVAADLSHINTSAKVEVCAAARGARARGSGLASERRRGGGGINRTRRPRRAARAAAVPSAA